MFIQIENIITAFTVFLRDFFKNILKFLQPQPNILRNVV